MNKKNSVFFNVNISFNNSKSITLLCEMYNLTATDRSGTLYYQSSSQLDLNIFRQSPLNTIKRDLFDYHKTDKIKEELNISDIDWIRKILAAEFKFDFQISEIHISEISMANE